MPSKHHKFDEKVETHLAQIVVDREYVTGKMNQQYDFSDFESYVDMFDAERVEKEYDWMSDISIPEFASHMLTQSSIDVSQYFSTRDFVETFINDEGDMAQKAAKSNQELINRTLNRRDLYHYQKFVRSKTINHLGGHVDYQCWWERDGYTESEIDEDDYGEPVEIETDVVTKDKFCYEVLDPRNVFTDSKYCYSMQDREWVIIRSERSLTQLKKEAKQFGYFNLDLLEDDKHSSAYKTETHTKTVEDGTSGKTLPENKTGAPYDILKRYGKHWVDDRDWPGINENGEVKKGAEFAEVVMTFAVKGGIKILIGFHRQPYKDAFGNTYRPLIRGLCYIHPTRDAGVGDGRYTRDLSTGINDTFNVSQDRTMLATMPTFKVKKYLAEDTDTLYWEPGHGMEVNEKDDIEEFRISDNTEAAMRQLGMLFGKMQQTDAIYPTTMGDVGQASTTATAFAGADQRSNQRTNYKSMTWEYTAATELYWMITQMTYQFATEDTAVLLMGEEKAYDFNPTLEYTYKPLSQSIETEYAKSSKVKLWLQFLGYLVPLGPAAADALNYILVQVAELMGDEYSKFAHIFFDPNKMEQPKGDQQAMASQGGGPSNQYNVPQSVQESGARGQAGGY